MAPSPSKTGGDILNHPLAPDSGGQRTVTAENNGTGIFLRNTVGASFNDMALSNFSNFAIYGNHVTGFNLSNSTISGTNGTNAASNEEEASIRFDDSASAACDDPAPTRTSAAGRRAISTSRTPPAR